MQIEEGAVVALEYKLHLGDGKVIDESEPAEPLRYLHGQGQIVPGLERELLGLSAGDTRKVVVEPKEGYGEHDPRGLQEVPRTAFPEGVTLKTGTRFMAQAEDGEAVPIYVREVKQDAVVVDLNHPLAGKTLHFEVTVREVRAATPEELEHGHIHGPGGAH
jgi:FKBP-type peptidyl-prolyl cis-trans isomerase SlyD